MRYAAALILLAAVLPATAHAEVVKAEAGGFSVSYKLNIAAPPAKVWAALIRPARWWSSDHTYSGSAANLTLDPRAGGCWCETLKDGIVEHMRVVFIQQDQRLRLAGGLGPLQSLAVSGAMEFALKPTGTGTELTVTYTVGGWMPGGLDKLAASVDAVFGAQVANLKRVAEAG